MLSASVAERRYDIMIGVMIFESAFLTDSLRLGVPLIVSAPDSIESKVIEAS